MAITVPVIGQEISVATFGAPVANEVNRMTPLVVAPTPWVGVTFLNNWVNFAAGFQLVQYRKIGDIVSIRGLMKSGTIETPSFVLPAGFVPPATVQFATASNALFAYFEVRPDGNMVVKTPSSNAACNVGCSYSITA